MGHIRIQLCPVFLVFFSFSVALCLSPRFSLSSSPELSASPVAGEDVASFKRYIQASVERGVLISEGLVLGFTDHSGNSLGLCHPLHERHNLLLYCGVEWQLLPY